MTRPFETEPVPPACEPTVDRLQAVLDGELTADALDADPHPAVCAACRERVRAARLLVLALAEPADPVAVPVGLTTAILAGVAADRRKAARRRAFAAVGGLAVAAAVVLAVWRFGGPKPVEQGPPAPPEMANVPPPSAPEPRPIRINDELAKAGDALRDSSRTITEPAASGGKVFTSFTTAFTKLPGNPLPADLEPVRRSLAEIPAAAQSGLEPVTGSAQKAFNRLIKDVVAVTPPKPKS